jgi:hypothetical protein
MTRPERRGSHRTRGARVADDTDALHGTHSGGLGPAEHRHRVTAIPHQAGDIPRHAPRPVGRVGKQFVDDGQIVPMPRPGSGDSHIEFRFAAAVRRDFTWHGESRRHSVRAL